MLCYKYPYFIKLCRFITNNKIIVEKHYKFELVITSLKCCFWHHSFELALELAFLSLTYLQHFAWGWLNSWWHMGRIESRLFDFSEVVLWIFVQSETTNRYQRVVTVGPDLKIYKYAKHLVISTAWRFALNV